MIHMKKWFVLLLALLLTSCITVDDPGVYWDKAGIDQNLIGKWILTSSHDNSSEIDFVHVYSRGDDMGIDQYKNKKKIQNENYAGEHRHSLHRSLKIDPYTFLLVKYADASMIMLRYEVKENALVLYNDRAGFIGYFLKKNYPQELNIALNSYSYRDVISEKYLEIYRLTDEVINILAKIPNDDTHWEINHTYEKF